MRGWHDVVQPKLQIRAREQCRLVLKRNVLCALRLYLAHRESKAHAHSCAARSVASVRIRIGWTRLNNSTQTRLLERQRLEKIKLACRSHCMAIHRRHAFKRWHQDFMFLRSSQRSCMHCAVRHRTRNLLEWVWIRVLSWLRR